MPYQVNEAVQDLLAGADLKEAIWALVKAELRRDYQVWERENGVDDDSILNGQPGQDGFTGIMQHVKG